MMTQTRSESDPAVDISRDGAVAVVRLNRPERLNAMDAAMIVALNAAMAEVSADPAVRAVVLAGAGRSFMAGADISLFQRDLETAPAMAAALIDDFHGMLRTIRAMRKPVVVALQGAIAGGGLGLALACDLGVMADDAQLISGYGKLGTSPDAGTTWSLTHLLGRQRALEVMWLNDPIDAAQAHRLGLVNRVVPAAQVQDEALTLARRLAEEAPGALGRVKALVEAATTSSFDDQLDLEKAGFVASAAEADFREGITAFFERRAPRFTGQ